MLRAKATSQFWTHILTLAFSVVCLFSWYFVCLFVQPEQRRSLWNAKLFPVVHPFDVLEDDAGEDDILWLASTDVSDTPDQQKLNRFVEVTFALCFVCCFFFLWCCVFVLHCVVFVVWCWWKELFGKRLQNWFWFYIWLAGNMTSFLWLAKVFYVSFLNTGELLHARQTLAKRTAKVRQTWVKCEANARKPQGKRSANARQTKGKFKADAVFSSRVILMNIYSFRWRSSLRLSLKDILNAVDTGSEFAWRKKLWFEIGKTEVEGTLNNCSSNCLVPFFKSCGKEGFESQILEVLDRGTCNCRL